MPQDDDLPAVYSDAQVRALVEHYLIDDGAGVDYGAWKDNAEDYAALKAQVDLIARLSPKTHPDRFPTETAARSYWINSYNLLIIEAVLEYWPLESVKDVKLSFGSRVVPGKGFFLDREIVVGGETTNLLDLEQMVLAQQKDPRLHFAFNCASSSCPVLRAEDWTEEALDQAAREYINDPDNVAVEDGKVRLSRIFKWYKKDFPRDIYPWLQQYAEPGLRAQLQAAIDGRYKRKFNEYDWSLNDGDDEEGS